MTLLSRHSEIASSYRCFRKLIGNIKIRLSPSTQLPLLPAFPGCVAGAQEEPRVAAGSTYGNGFGRASCLFFTARVCGTIGTGSGALGNFGWKFICFPAGVLYIRVCVCVSCSSRRMLQIESGAMELTMGQIEQSSSSS